MLCWNVDTQSHTHALHILLCLDFFLFRRPIQIYECYSDFYFLTNSQNETILTLFTRVYTTIIRNDCPHSSSKYSLAAHFMNLCYVTFFWLASDVLLLWLLLLLLLLWIFFSLFHFLLVVVTLFRSISLDISIVGLNRRALSILSLSLYLSISLSLSFENALRTLSLSLFTYNEFVIY